MNENYIKDSLHKPKLRGFSLGLLIMLCVMYQVYFYGISAEQALIGTSWQRDILKLLGLTIFYLSLLKVLSVKAMLSNFILKVPLIFFGMVTVFVSPFLGPFEIQAVNMIFFIPLLAIDFDKFKYEYLFNSFFSVFSIILIIQVLLDPILKVLTGIYYTNMALIGGVGNANSFGYLLLCSAIYYLLCLRNRRVFYFLCFASLFTGSLVILVAAGFMVLLSFLNSIRNLNFYNLAVYAIFTVILFFIFDIFFKENIGNSFKALNHSLEKFLSLMLFLEGAQFESASISVRKDYTLEGLRLITDNPWSLLIGHPEMTALYTGDGWWLGLIVTHGLLWTMLFLVCNVFAFFKGLKLRTPEGRCSSFVILLTCTILLTNRVLDYWPAAIVYIFVLAYVSNKKRQLVT
jgi:hypothetical protein